MAGKWKIFPVENIHKLSGCRKEHADHFPVENGSNFPVESENFPDTPMETLVMHPANTEDARNGAGQSQTCRVLETPNTLCNRNMSFLLLGFLANFPEYFPEKRVMRNGFATAKGLKMLFLWGNGSKSVRIVQLKRGQTCTFQTCTLFSARYLASTTSRLPSMPSVPPPLYGFHTK